MDSYKSSDPELLLLLLLSGLELSCPDLHATLTASFLMFLKGGGLKRHVKLPLLPSAVIASIEN